MKDIKSVVLSSTQKLLKPLIRLLVHCGVSHLELNELVKKSYVDVCYQYFEIPGRKNSISRVAVLSGLSRKEVVKWTQFLEKTSVSDDITRSINRASRVLGAWLQDKEYLDAKGQPCELAVKGIDPSFKSLAKRYAGDVTYGAILDELFRIGAVSETREGRIKLQTQGYLPGKSEIEKIDILGTSSNDLLTTAVHNVTHPDNLKFQRELVYTELSQPAIEEFKLISREKSMELLLELNQWLANKKKIEKQLGRLHPKSRAGLGIYIIEDELSEEIEQDNKQ